MGSRTFSRILACGCSICPPSDASSGDGALLPCYADFSPARTVKEKAKLELHNKCWAEYKAREKNDHYLPRKTKAEKAELKRVPGTPIQVWRFDQAPKELQALSDNGGDEDWVAVVPAKLWEEEGKFIPWLGEDRFGICHVNEYKTKNGDVVLIGCHA